MSPTAVLFDFSATLFDPARVVDGAGLAAQARRRGSRLDAGTAQRLADRILAHAESDRGRRTRQRCDLSADEHRQGWVATVTEVPGVTIEIAEAFHDCITDPARWHPYPDTAATLAALRAAGARVGVVSNCGWDLRAAFRRAGLDRFVDTWTLSCEHGRQKPDPELFRMACAALGVRPGEALMVGDDPGADGGALAAGIPVLLLPPAPPFPAARGLGLVQQLVSRVPHDEGEPIRHDTPTADGTAGHRVEPGSGRLRADREGHHRPAR
ncbi:MAG TPA: HAD family hydrolase [Micromonosporaceae bacterium]|nr:HAD family hydrolase [Micromonosporaceae bacterium]